MIVIDPPEAPRPLPTSAESHQKTNQKKSRGLLLLQAPATVWTCQLKNRRRRKTQAPRASAYPSSSPTPPALCYVSPSSLCPNTDYCLLLLAAAAPAAAVFSAQAACYYDRLGAFQQPEKSILSEKLFVWKKVNYFYPDLSGAPLIISVADIQGVIMPPRRSWTCIYGSARR